MLETIKKTADFLVSKVGENYEVGIILGTGLGDLVSEIDVTHSLAYEDIPNFPLSTVEGHSGKLIFGNLGGKRVVALQGRFHYYEGYSMNEVVFPVRVMKFLGIKTLVVSNASGGVNPDFEIGDIMVLDDHINLFGDNPLIGKNMDELGPRFPDMSEPYDRNLIQKVHQIAKENSIEIQQGSYAGLSGPTLETPAEYNYVRAIGADTVGMSTVPEVIAARHMGIPCVGFSIITDLGVPGKIIEMTHDIVQEVARKSTPKVTKIVKELIFQLG
jgi:purine-nucleoside phosphorylase